jgi:hypothetical protein
MKLKEWRFDKYLSTTDMQIIVNKSEKRAREEGKNTRFFYNGVPLLDQKFKTSRKGKLQQGLVLKRLRQVRPPGFSLIK